jgi:hypothetical protein
LITSHPYVSGWLFCLPGCAEVNHKTSIDNEVKIIYCTLEGELDIEKSISLSKNLRETASELGFNVLYEASKLQEPISDTPVHDLTVKLSSILDATILREVMVAGCVRIVL